MSGYIVAGGYMGWVEKLNKHILFATEDDYLEYLEERKEESHESEGFRTEGKAPLSLQKVEEPEP